MKKRKLKKTILAAVLALPVAFSTPGWAVRAQEDVISDEINMSEDKNVPDEIKVQDGAEPDETEYDGNSDSGEQSGTEKDNSQSDWNISDGENDFQDDSPETGGEEFFSSLAENENTEDDFLLFQDELESLEEGETDDQIAAYVAPENYVQEGSPVRNGSGGFTAVANGNTIFSSKYTRLGWNEDTQVYPWNNAGSDVVSGMKQGAMVEGPYFVPLNNNAKGKFGFRVTHVGYNKEANTKVDLLLTCNNYQDYTYDYKGNKITGIYPMFGVSNAKELWISFKDELAAQEIKVDIVKSGTNTPVAGNYRFRWLDIDLYQRFGIVLQNGSIGHRYATTDSVVNVVNKTLFSKSFEVLTAPAPAVDGEVPQNTVVYELDNSSGFYLAILRPGYGAYSIETASRIKSVFANVKTGTCKTSAGLNWDAKGYGPVEYPGIIKKTGNTLADQGTSNSLSDSTSEFYYTLQTDIPEEHSAYYYSSCTVSDTLPAGVDYSGYAAVKMLPSENDVSSWFNISTDGDVINFQATPAALASADFYGKTYEFQIKVRMDPTEITPAYNGDSYRYEVKNKASITCQHVNGLAGTSWSNEVTTDCTRYKNKVQGTSVKKYTANLWAGEWKEDLLLPDPDSEYKYKLNINVPDNEFGGYMTKMEITDTLPPGAELVVGTTAVYENGQNRVDGRFQISVNGKTLTLKATEAALGYRGFYGKSYDVIFNAKMVPGQISCTYNGTVASYVTSNHFTVTTQHKGDSQAATVTSNNVADRASVSRTEPGNPQKWILKENQRVTTAEYTGRDFENVFEIVQAIPSNKREWKISKFKIQDTLADCFELKRVQVYIDQMAAASFGASGGVNGSWSLAVAGNLVAVSSLGELPENCYGKSVRVLLTVGLKGNYDLQQYYVSNQNPDILEAHIYNIATSTFDWIGGEPSSTSRNTEKTKVIVKEPTPKGHITVKKVDETGNALQNGQFQIIAAEDIRSAAGNLLLKGGDVADTITTDKNGTAVSKEIYLGKYRVKEVRPPQGYTISQQVYDVNLSKTELEKAITVPNRKMYMYIKKVSETESQGGERQAIEGVKFRLWESSMNGDTAGTTYTTDKNGLIKLEGLIPGTYCVQEISVPSGYVLDDEIYKFTVDINGLVHNENGYTMVIENHYTKAEFLKTDKVTGEAVAGAVMQLTDKNGKVIDTWTSGKSAHRINKLTAGEYVLTEITAPSGYKKGKSVACVVKSISEVQKFQMTDVKLVTLSIDKILHGDEIVWGQGNPAFTFTVKGTDLDGDEHVYYKTVEFAEKNTDTRADVSKKVVFTLPAGKYQVQESKVMRYELEKIDQVANGSVQGSSVHFDLSKNQNGTAAFTNRKKGDGLLTDTDYVRNIVIPEK